MKSYVVTAQPSIEPVTAQDAADFLRVSDATEIARLGSLISVAREMVEDFTGRALMLTGYRCASSDFGENLDDIKQLTLDRSPLVAISSVKYIAEGATTETTMDTADYVVVTDTLPGRVLFTGDLPALATRPDAVRVAFTAGASDAGAVRASLKQAILLLVSHLYENRAATTEKTVNDLPLGIRHILESHRIGGFIA